LQKEHPLLLVNFTELASALTINPLLDQLPTKTTFQLPLHLKQKTRSRIILQQVDETDQSKHANIRVGLCCLTECLTVTFWLTNRDTGTKSLNRVCPG